MDLRFFFAERRCCGSNFRMETTIVPVTGTCTIWGLEAQGFLGLWTLDFCFVGCFVVFDIYILLYYIILCYVMLYYIILYYTILYYIILYYVMLCYIILYHIILYYIILYYIILYYIIILYYTILYYIILYYIILYYITLYTDMIVVKGVPGIILCRLRYSRPRII